MPDTDFVVAKSRLVTGKIEVVKVAAVILRLCALRARLQASLQLATGSG